jgi:CRP/FNR family transcriptional regulator
MSSELHPIFPDFSADLLDAIDDAAVVKHFEAGATLIRTGQYIKSTLLVTKGKLKVYREDDDGNEFFMYYLLPGQACAISLICATRSKQSQIMAKAIEDSEVLMVPLDLMDTWMAKYKNWYEFVISTYRNRFEEILEVVDNIAFRAMDERLEFHLNRMKETTGSPDLKLSHQEIASDLNTSREVISRLLKKMEQRGLVKLHRNHIELLN